jgi:hypothetical protein
MAEHLAPEMRSKIMRAIRAKNKGRASDTMSASNQSDHIVEPSPEAKALTNSERLLQHLKPDSLAARLVQAHTADPREGLRNALTERVAQVRQKLAGAAN